MRSSGCETPALPRVCQRVRQMVRLYPLMLITATAGCAGSMGTLRPDAPAAPPVTTFDGQYQTTIALTTVGDAGTETAWCQTPGQPVVTIVNGRFSYAVPHPNISGNPTPVFQATMAADGSFSGRVNDGSLSGRIQGTHMDASIEGVSCIYAIAGTRI
jgi:hypothetical protein